MHHFNFQYNIFKSTKMNPIFKYLNFNITTDLVFPPLQYMMKEVR